MESDPEGVPWRFEFFTEIPEVIDSYMTVPTTPGWGCDLNEDALKKYAWNK
jgi:L-alanine-DL-glutamate epimerase-like enolase superfamily enzyme